MRGTRLLLVVGAIVLIGAACSGPPPGLLPELRGATQLSGRCVVLGAGASAKCWGDNSEGQLGNALVASNDYLTVPVPVTGLSGIEQLSSGAGHVCALVAGGAARCWGRNGSGQLGTGDRSNRVIPTPVVGLTGATQISAGVDTTCALLGDGSVRCWGGNVDGTLGNGTYTDSSLPVAVVGLTDVTEVSVGGLHACALKADGTVWCWGNDVYGQMGDGSRTTVPPYGVNVPVQVSGISSAVQVRVGSQHTCARLADGTVRCWGRSDLGQLGSGTADLASPYGVATPVAVVDLAGVTDLATTANNTCAIVSGGTLRCWGDNDFGALGTGAPSADPVPVPVTAAEVSGALQVAATGLTTCVLVDGGRVRCWGAGFNGALGSGSVAPSNHPVSVLAGL